MLVSQRSSKPAFPGSRLWALPLQQSEIVQTLVSWQILAGNSGVLWCTADVTEVDLGSPVQMRE